jgi:tetratricopeptide (TPR) repeat protein
VALLLWAVAGGTCGCAYYNTYYNIKKRFHEAEKEHASRPGEALSTPGLPVTPGAPYVPSRSGTGSSSGAEKYRKVLETGSKLLEFHPKSRWVDDTLLLMGISYYRIQDWTRAERKFNEIVTIYPKSEHVGEARLWKARTLKEQKRIPEAIQDLEAGIATLDDKASRARSEALLAELQMTTQSWSSAADNYTNAIPHLSRQESVNAYYQLGICHYQLGDFARARAAFLAAAPQYEAKELAFQAYTLGTRCAVALGDFESARRTLLKLRESSRFLIYAADIEIELAQLAVSSGNVEAGIAEFESIVRREANGPQRGKAFYRHALVERDSRANLQAAKALLDSAIVVGASREIQDSARAATEQISKGLVAIESIFALRDSIGNLQELLDSTALGESLNTLEPETPARVPQFEHTEIAPAVLDTNAVVAIFDSTAAEAQTSDLSEQVPDSISVGAPPVEFSPARAAADSLLRLLDQQDAARRAELSRLADTSSTSLDSSAAVAPPVVANKLSRAQITEALLKTRKALQRAYLRAAEFYLFSLSEQDSALTYYAQAASNPVEPNVYWKANLYLARVFALDSATAEQSLDFYRAIMDADSTPLDARNEARAQLGLERLADPRDEQRTLFEAAEAAQLMGEVSLADLPALYARVVDLDSTTAEAFRALAAQYYIYDGRLGMFRLPDSVQALGARIESMFPDSGLVREIKRVLAPDDSSSLYLMTDAELLSLYMPKQDVSIEETPSETGWPPPEESLRGRRFN